jgi:hypothetical protein
LSSVIIKEKRDYMNNKICKGNSHLKGEIGESIRSFVPCCDLYSKQYLDHTLDKDNYIEYIKGNLDGNLVIDDEAYKKAIEDSLNGVYKMRAKGLISNLLIDSLEILYINCQKDLNSSKTEL